MKKRVLALKICVFAGLFLGAGLWVILDTPWFTARIMRVVMSHQMSNVKLTDLSIKTQRFSFPGKVALGDVLCKVSFNGRAATLEVHQVALTGLETLFSPKKALALNMTGMDVSFLPLRLSNVEASVTILRRDDGLFIMEGPVAVKKAFWDKAELDDLSFQLLGDAASLELRNIKGNLYGGAIQGDARVVMAGMSYIVNTDIKDVDIAKAGVWNASLSDQLSGQLSGKVSVAGRGEELSNITTDWHMLDGSSISAGLLSLLTQYIPQSREKKRLDALIKAGGKLPVQLLSFAVKTETPRHLKGEIHIKSKDVNLQINITNDINTDGTLISLLGYWQTYFR